MATQMQVGNDDTGWSRKPETATTEISSIRTVDFTVNIPQEPTQWSDAAVRGAVLELLREMSQKQLAKICPLSQPLLSGIVNGKYRGRIGSEKRQQFGNWYIEYRRSNPLPGNGRVLAIDRPQESRMTFHTTRELPLMRDWFRACKNPSGKTLQMYVDILNQGPVRQRERPKVTLDCLRNWWKNERQRERRQQGKPSEEPPLKKPRAKIKKTQNQVQTDPEVEVDVVHPDPPANISHGQMAHHHHHHHHHHPPIPRYELPQETLHLPT